MSSQSYRILALILAFVVVALPAAGQSARRAATANETGQYTRDEAANKKIREAIDIHYLATEFDKAEAMLIGVVEACADKCSPPTLAKAWMYVGIVRGSGKNDLAGARDGFQRAIALDPAVELDTQIATPETRKAFEDAGGGVAVRAPAETSAPAAAAPPVETPAAAQGALGLQCTPSVTEIETRRPIPVECRTQKEVASLELRFKPAGDEWQSLKMSRQGDSFRAEIPCDKTRISGRLMLFVRARDSSGDEVAGWGTKASPIAIRLVESTKQEAPSFDDADPPARCRAKEDCPPNFPGCGTKEARGGAVDWGGTCDNSSQCKSGLLCLDGACELPPSCDNDSECPVGTCIEGKCHIRSSERTTSGNKNWVGLHVAQDLTFVGGSDVCTQDAQSNENFSCYYGGSRTGAYIDEPYPGTSTGTSPVAATTRILASYDHAITTHWVAGVRAGYALSGGPPAGRDVVYDNEGRIVEVVEEGLPFLPLHLEARGSYWFGGGVLSRNNIRPYVHVAGGLAQVDAKVTVPVKDCGLYAPQGTQAYADCAGGDVPSNDGRLRSVELDAWKKLGQGFVALGGGALYALTDQIAAQLNVNLMYTLPASGVVVEPSLGAAVGF